MVTGYAMCQSAPSLLDLYTNRPGFVHPNENPNLLPPAYKTSPASDLPIGQCILSAQQPVQEMAIQGLDEPTVTWTSIFPGSEGEWNQLVSCSVGCEKVQFRFNISAPPVVDFRVCGTPQPLERNDFTRCKVLRVRYVNSQLPP
jgi:hypothetical protein